MLILGLHIFNFFCSYLVCRRQIQKVKGYLPSKTKMNDKRQVSRPILWPHHHHHGCSSSQRALLWKSIFFASLLAHIAQAQDEVRIRWILIYHQVGKMFSIMFALSWSLFTDKKTDQVGDMDNTDVSSDYTSNCLPPNCLPRWRYLPGCLKLQPIEKMMFVMVFWQLARENDNKSSADLQQGPVQWHSGQN